MQAPLELLDSVRRQVLIRRRALAALCVALAAWCVLDSVSTSPPTTVTVVTAAHDLDSGTTLRADDLARVGFAPGSVPPGAVREPARLVGRTLLAPLGRGEPLGNRHLLGKGVLEGYPDRSAIGLRIPDEDTAALLHAGDVVDIVASDPQGGAEAEPLVRDAAVLGVPARDPDAARTGSGSEGRLVLFAVPTKDAPRVAAVAASRFLTVIWNR